jgi:hypothetical protein
MALLVVTMCAGVAVYVAWPLLFPVEPVVPAEATRTNDLDDNDAVPDALIREVDDIELLWALANHQKKAGDWMGLGRTLEGICQLDPHRIGTWKHIAWNLVYNVAEERENVDDRYQCVRKAIEALLLGVAKNSTNPQIYWETGRIMQSMGRKTPDSRHFRRAFARDSALHKLLAEHVEMDVAHGPTGQPDSWLVARLWYLESEKIAKQHGVPPNWRLVEIVWFEQAPRCLLMYAAAAQAEGCSEELAARNWRRAEREWRQFCGRKIYPGQGEAVRISDDESSRLIVNFEEKLQRCQLEQTQEILTARTHLFRAQDASEKKEAQRLYEIAWTSWAAAINRHDTLLDNDWIVSELGRTIDHYRDTMLRDDQLPEGFPLTNVVERCDEIQDEFEAALKQLYPDLKLDLDRGKTSSQFVPTY